MKNKIDKCQKATCIFYRPKRGMCIALKEVYCECEECNFYKEKEPMEKQ